MKHPTPRPNPAPEPVPARLPRSAQQLLGAVALLTLLGACGDGPSLVLPYDPTPVGASIPSVLAALRDGEPERALTELDRLERTGVLPDGALHYRALALSDAGRTDDALTAWDRELETNPGNARAHTFLAELLIELGRLDEAGAHLDQARTHAPDLPALALVSGQYALLRLDDEAAGRHYRDYLTSDPFSPHAAAAHSALAQLAARRGEQPVAEAHSRAAEQLEEVHRALNRFRQVLAEDPRDVNARFGVAAAYLSLYEHLTSDPQLLAQAEGALLGVLDIDPDNPRALFNMGFVRTMEGQDVEATEYYERTLEVDPGHMDARLNLARLLLRGGEQDRPVELLEQVALEATDPLPAARAHAVLGELLAESDPAAARRHLERYLELFPEDPQRLGPLLQQLRERAGEG